MSRCGEVLEEDPCAGWSGLVLIPCVKICEICVAGSAVQAGYANDLIDHVESYIVSAPCSVSQVD
jgi:hypothetical protein